MLDLPKKHKVIFKGSLKKFGTFEIAGYTPAECIRAVAVQVPELYTKIYNGHFIITHRQAKFKQKLNTEQCFETFNYNQAQIIEVLPVAIGATGSGDDAGNIGMIVAGAILLIAGIVGSFFTAGLSSTIATVAVKLLISASISVGMTLITTGIANLLAPTEEAVDDEKGYNFSGPQNMTKQGSAVPLIYGHIGVGTVVISHKLNAVLGTESYPYHSNGEITNFKSMSQIVDLLGEGEIVGLVNGYKSIYLDGIPAMDENNNLNFNYENYQVMTGNNNSHLFGDCNKPQSIVSAGDNLEYDKWLTYTIINPETDYVIVSLNFDHIYYSDDKDGHKDKITTVWYAQVADKQLIWEDAKFYKQSIGEVWEATEQTFKQSKVEVKTLKFIPGTDGGAAEEEYELTYIWYYIDPETKQTKQETSTIISNSRWYKDKYITRKVAILKQSASNVITSNGAFLIRTLQEKKFGLSFVIDLSYLDRSGIRYFRFKRGTPQEQGKGTAHISGQLVSYSEVVDVKLNYEGRAIAASHLQADAHTGQIPTRIFEVKGLIIDVPSNYDPETRYYDGLWDGTYKKAWTNNPVWVLKDLLTNGKYGLGRDIQDKHIDKWSFYYAAQYCDEYVSDGNGGKEPRFVFNGVINSREDAFSVIQQIASVFRSVLYASNGKIFISQDAPQLIRKTFGNINVIDGLFHYEGTAAKARHSAISVTWINPETLWQPEIELIEDAYLIEKYGYNLKEVTAQGCTSRGQAQRIARHILYSEEYETNTVTFSVTIKDNDLRPGDIIYIQDEMINGRAIMGAVVEVSTQTIIVDRKIRMSTGNTYAILITDSEGNVYEKHLVNREMETDTLWIRSDNFFNEKEVEKFQSGSIYSLIENDDRPVQYKILSIIESTNEDDYNTILTVTALQHFEDKYKYIDENIQFDRPLFTYTPEAIQPPSFFQCHQDIEKVNGINTIKATFVWELPSDIRISDVDVKIEYPNSNGQLVDFGRLAVSNNSVTVENAGVGPVTARLRSYSQTENTTSVEVVYTTELYDPYINPPMPLNLKAEVAFGVVTFTWDKPNYPLPLTYEFYTISPNGTRTALITLNNSISISESYSKYPATITIYVRCVNEIGMMSEWARTSATIQPVNLDISNFLDDIDDSWLTNDSQQMLGSGGLLEQISTALLRSENYFVYRVDRTDSELAIAVDGLSVLTEDHKALASKVTFIGAFVGEQLTSDEPDKFNLKWYDGSDPQYPATPNPLYNENESLSIENYPYLPVYPNQSLGGYLMEVYSGDDFVKGQITNSLRADMNNITSEIKENMVTVINDKGEIESEYSVRIDGKNREGQPIIGGFGLQSDGYNTSFGVNAHTFWIRDPEWKEGNNPFDEYLFVTDVEENITYIGTNNTVFKGKVQSLSYIENNKEGFSLDPKTNTFELNSNTLRFKIDNTGHNKWFKKQNNSFQEIIDIGETEPNGYSYAVNVNVKKFNNSAMKLNANNNNYQNNVKNPKYLENTCLAINGGSYGIKDISNDNCYLTIKNTKSLIINNFTRNHSTLKFPSYELRFDFSTGSTARLDQEVANYNIMLSYFVLKTLNDMVNADCGSMICLPCPFTKNPDIGEVFDLRPLYHDIWVKTTPGKIVSYNSNLSVDIAQKQPLFGDFIYKITTNNSEGSVSREENLGYGYLYVRFEDRIGGRNRFRYYHPKTFAGWERITNSGYYSFNVNNGWIGRGMVLDDASALPYSLVYKNS